MRILVVDWTSEGHHAIYLDRIAASLEPHAEVHVAAPAASLSALGGRDCTLHPLESSRPRERAGRGRRAQSRMLAEAELAIVREHVDRLRPELTVHPYADPLLSTLVREPQLGSPLAIVVFFPSFHYPRAFGTALDPRQRLRAAYKEALVGTFRRRRDAAAVLTLDPVAAQRWSARAGAPAGWLPEPPVSGPLPGPRERHGVALVGTLAPRKGLDRLAAAARSMSRPVRLTIAGSVQAGYEPKLAEHVRTLERAGCEVDLRAVPHSEHELLEVTAGAQVVALPYPRHLGSSRVLLEAACVGTPVVAERFGLLGHLAVDAGLGLAVDTADPRRFAEALERSLRGDDGVDRSRREEFLARHSPAAFASALTGALGLETVRR